MWSIELNKTGKRIRIKGVLTSRRYTAHAVAFRRRSDFGFFQVEMSKRGFTLLHETSQFFTTGLDICHVLLGHLLPFASQNWVLQQKFLHVR